MKQVEAQKIIKKNQAIYNKIAGHFNKTRYHIWPELLEFKKYLKPNQEILDLGCGNGRLLKLFKKININYTGLDNSSKLLEQAMQNYPQQNFILGDLNKLPFNNNVFDHIFCIAALHHLPSVELRHQALQEIKRVLKPGGYFLMTNWNLWQKKYIYLIFKYSLLKILGKSKMDFKDVLIPWTLQQTGEKFLRYYHAFTNRELKKLAKANNFKIIKQRSSLKQTFNFISIWQK